MAEMIIDTGAYHTAFPATFAKRFGHNNDHRDVKSGYAYGVGGKSKCYYHSLRIGLLTKELNEKTVAWWSGKTTTQFITKFPVEYGILGMDVMREWQSLEIKNLNGGRLLVSITT